MNFEEFLSEHRSDDETVPFDMLPDRLYHTTKLSNEASIKKGGIRASTGGGTWLNRTYDPRVYLATSLIAAYDITVGFQAHDGSHEDYVIFEIDKRSLRGVTFYEDEKFNHGVYVKSDVPASAITGRVLHSELFGRFNDDDIDRLYTTTWHDYEEPRMNERAEISDVDGEVLVQHAGSSVQYTLVDADGEILGDIRVENGHVEGVVAEKGYGPLMYEIAMMSAYPEWIRPGSGSTTDAAFAVWVKFAERRDVESAYAGEQDRGRHSAVASMKFRMRPTDAFRELRFRSPGPDERVRVNKRAGAFFMRKLSEQTPKKETKPGGEFSLDAEF